MSQCCPLMTLMISSFVQWAVYHGHNMCYNDNPLVIYMTLATKQVPNSSQLLNYLSKELNSIEIISYKFSFEGGTVIWS